MGGYCAVGRLVFDRINPNALAKREMHLPKENMTLVQRGLVIMGTDMTCEFRWPSGMATYARGSPPSRCAEYLGCHIAIFSKHNFFVSKATLNRIQTHPIAARESPDSQVRQCLGGCIGSLMWIGALDLKLCKLSKIGADRTRQNLKCQHIHIVMTLSQLCHDFKVFPIWWGPDMIACSNMLSNMLLTHALMLCWHYRVKWLAQIIQLHVCLTRIWSGCLPVSQNLNPKAMIFV